MKKMQAGLLVDNATLIKFSIEFVKILIKYGINKLQVKHFVKSIKPQLNELLRAELPTIIKYFESKSTALINEVGFTLHEYGIELPRDKFVKEDYKQALISVLYVIIRNHHKQLKAGKVTLQTISTYKPTDYIASPAFRILDGAYLKEIPKNVMNDFRKDNLALINEAKENVDNLNAYISKKLLLNIINPIQGVLKTTIKTKKVEAIQLTANTKLTADFGSFSFNIALAYLASESVRLAIHYGLGLRREARRASYIKGAYKFIIEKEVKMIASHFLPELKKILKSIPEDILSRDKINYDTLEKAIITKVYKIIMANATEIIYGSHYELHEEWKVTEIAFPSLKKNAHKLLDSKSLFKELHKIDKLMDEYIRHIFDRITNIIIQKTG